jgi:cytochrome P450
MLRRALGQVFMRRIDDAATVDAVLKHPAFRDRAVLEKALSNRFFAPFVHQEVVIGERFEARARWSRAALSGISAERIVEAAHAACDAEIVPAVVDGLNDAVRRTVARATAALALGEPALVPLVQRAVVDFDRGIKMIGRPSMALRRELGSMLEQHLAVPERWAPATFLDVARKEALALPLRERVDHMASVFLATGAIQVSDVVTHALIALAQHPQAAGASDEAVVAEAIRIFPVNSSVTRQAARAVDVGGQAFAAGEPVTMVPRLLRSETTFDPSRTSAAPSWSFGAGPRACPARRLASTLAATILGRYRALGVVVEPGYQHERSLALPVRARIGEGPAPERTARATRAAGFARYAWTCAESYPAAFLIGFRELVEVVRMR